MEKPEIDGSCVWTVPVHEKLHAEEDEAAPVGLHREERAHSLPFKEGEHTVLQSTVPLLHSYGDLQVPRS